ncbi:MAG: hypothetical protein WCD76_13350 [Pyrinomonadaceae bacterium]
MLVISGETITQRSTEIMFVKGTFSPEVTIIVILPTRPDSQYSFTFPKKLPQAVLDAERELALKTGERSAEARVALVKAVAAMLVTDPEGFGDYPVKTEEGTVESRALEYFDDPNEPELETILVNAWFEYREAVRPRAYLKSVSRDGATTGDVPATVGQP